MEFIRTLREKQQTQRKADIQQQAINCITLSDFDSELYIAYNGTPFVPINPEWTSREIVEELSKLRQNYINARLWQENGKRTVSVI